MKTIEEAYTTWISLQDLMLFFGGVNYWDKIPKASKGVINKEMRVELKVPQKKNKFCTFCFETGHLYTNMNSKEIAGYMYVSSTKFKIQRKTISLKDLYGS